MVYDARHTRELDVLQTMSLSKAIPSPVDVCHCEHRFDGTCGFSGFRGGMQVIIGAWQAFRRCGVSGMEFRDWRGLHAAWRCRRRFSEMAKNKKVWLR